MTLGNFSSKFSDEAKRIIRSVGKRKNKIVNAKITLVLMKHVFENIEYILSRFIEYMYINIYIHIHMYMYVYIYLYIYIYILGHRECEYSYSLNNIWIDSFTSGI